MTPLADFIGPVGEGVILFGVVPAALLVAAMMAISRLIEWRTDRSFPSEDPDSTVSSDDA